MVNRVRAGRAFASSTTLAEMDRAAPSLLGLARAMAQSCGAATVTASRRRESRHVYDWPTSSRTATTGPAT